MAPSDVVDLRSDTVTRPTAAMRRAMAEAEVGDDGYGEDPTVNRLEAAYAERVGKAAAVFVPGTRVIAGAGAHVVTYEHGAAGMNSGVQLHVVDDSDGTITPADVAETLAAVAHHHPEVSAVFAEDTHMPSRPLASRCTSTAPDCSTRRRPPVPTWPAAPRRPPP